LIASGPRESPEGVIDRFHSLLLNVFALNALVAIPLAVWAGAIYSFRFFGPLRHFRQHFLGHVEGPWDEPLELRCEDELQGIKDSINASQSLMIEALRRQQALMAQARRVLEATPRAVRDSAEVLDLIARLEGQGRELDRRLSSAKPASDGAPEQLKSAREE